MAATAGAIGVCGKAIVFIDVGLIVVCVTARTFRLVSRRLPVDYFRIRLVAPGAVEISTMIQRLVRQCRMCKVVRQPRRRVMAFVTFFWRNEMTIVDAGCYRAVVTGRAGTKYLGVFHYCCRHKYCRIVTVLAYVSGLDVGRVLASCISAVVAGSAGCCYVGMIEVSR